MKITSLFTLVAALLVTGCATTDGEKVEKGPHGTIAYFIEVESSEAGARIEVNNEAVGKTPMRLKVFGDKDGTFHNFGSYDYFIKVYPVRPGQHVQSKLFKTGGWWTQEDKIPSRLFFDLDLKTEGFSIDLPAPKTNP